MIEINLNEQQVEFLRQTLLGIDFDKISETSKIIINQILMKLDDVQITIEQDYLAAKDL